LRAGEIGIAPIDADRMAHRSSLVARRWNFLNTCCRTQSDSEPLPSRVRKKPHDRVA
jgi:hypothetical protein